MGVAADCSNVNEVSGANCEQLAERHLENIYIKQVCIPAPVRRVTVEDQRNRVIRAIARLRQ
jgi:hypothetical protein